MSVFGSRTSRLADLLIFGGERKGKKKKTMTAETVVEFSEV